MRAHNPEPAGSGEGDQLVNVADADEGCTAEHDSAPCPAGIGVELISLEGLR